jgi:hypothetical protein
VRFVAIRDILLLVLDLVDTRWISLSFPGAAFIDASV